MRIIVLDNDNTELFTYDTLGLAECRFPPRNEVPRIIDGMSEAKKFLWNGASPSDKSQIGVEEPDADKPVKGVTLTPG